MYAQCRRMESSRSRISFGVVKNIGVFFTSNREQMFLEIDTQDKAFLQQLSHYHVSLNVVLLNVILYIRLIHPSSDSNADIKRRKSASRI